MTRSDTDLRSTRGSTAVALSRRRHAPAELWRRNRILAGLAALQALLLVGFVAGLALDPRTVGGDPAWLKPAKFAGSIALLAGALAWLSEHLPIGERRLRAASLAIGAVGVFEIALIGTQAARGVPSHFNDATPLDLGVYAAMGLAISLLWALVVLLAALTWRRSMTVRPAFAAGVRFGLALFSLGAGVGFVIVAAGQSAVGPGPTVPVVGWAIGGDLRVAHFVGLHALQALPLAGYAAALGARRGLLDRPVLAVRSLGAAYLFVVFAALGHALAALAA